MSESKFTNNLNLELVSIDIGDTTIIDSVGVTEIVVKYMVSLTENSGQFAGDEIVVTMLSSTKQICISSVYAPTLSYSDNILEDSISYWGTAIQLLIPTESNNTKYPCDFSNDQSTDDEGGGDEGTTDSSNSAGGDSSGTSGDGSDDSSGGSSDGSNSDSSDGGNSESSAGSNSDSAGGGNGGSSGGGNGGSSDGSNSDSSNDDTEIPKQISFKLHHEHTEYEPDYALDADGDVIESCGEPWTDMEYDGFGEAELKMVTSTYILYDIISVTYKEYEGATPEIVYGGELKLDENMGFVSGSFGDNNRSIHKENTAYCNAATSEVKGFEGFIWQGII